MGASGTRHSLRPLSLMARNDCCKTWAHSRCENAELYLELSTSLRGALATKQSSSSLLSWIASLTLAMTAWMIGCLKFESGDRCERDGRLRALGARPDRGYDGHLLQVRRLTLRLRG